MKVWKKFIVTFFQGLNCSAGYFFIRVQPLAPPMEKLYIKTSVAWWWVICIVLQSFNAEFSWIFVMPKSCLDYFLHLQWNNCSKKQLLLQSLWLNSLIRVHNKTIYYLSWSSQGIQNIGHLMENETRFLSFSEFKERYNIKTNFLHFCGVISAVKHLVITFNKNASQESIN